MKRGRAAQVAGSLRVMLYSGIPSSSPRPFSTARVQPVLNERSDGHGHIATSQAGSQPARPTCALSPHTNSRALTKRYTSQLNYPYPYPYRAGHAGQGIGVLALRHRVRNLVIEGSSKVQSFEREALRAHLDLKVISAYASAFD